MHRGVHFAMMQPCGSRMFRSDWAYKMNQWGLPKVYLWLGHYGARSPWPTMMVGTLPFIRGLSTRATKTEMSNFKAFVDNSYRRKRIVTILELLWGGIARD
jgi:hypothetical protein